MDPFWWVFPNVTTVFVTRKAISCSQEGWYRSNLNKDNYRSSKTTFCNWSIIVWKLCHDLVYYSARPHLHEGQPVSFLLLSYSSILGPCRVTGCVCVRACVCTCVHAWERENVHTLPPPSKNVLLKSNGSLQELSATVRLDLKERFIPLVLYSVKQPVSFSCCRNHLAAWRHKSLKLTVI